MNPRRLIIRPGAIGDCILALPAMEWLAGAETEVWVASQNVPLIRFAARVRGIASTGLDLAGIPDREPPAGLFDQLRRFDEIVSWYGGGRAEFREAMKGLPFRYLAALPAGGGPMHAADFFASQVGAPLPAVPRIEVAGEPRAPHAVIHPFSGGRKKNWPLDRFRELAAGLTLPVAWCAGPEEELAGAVRFDNLYELARWLSRARLYIGNDSGITHLAAAVGTPVLAIFSTTDPRMWAPRGARVRVAVDPTVSEALAAAGEILLRSR